MKKTIKAEATYFEKIILNRNQLKNLHVIKFT